MYEKLDAAIIENVKRGNAKFGSIYDSVTFAIPHQQRVDGWRTVDRRLQALRKKGLIRFIGGGWKITESEAE